MGMRGPCQDTGQGLGRRDGARSGRLQGDQSAVSSPKKKRSLSRVTSHPHRSTTTSRFIVICKVPRIDPFAKHLTRSKRSDCAEKSVWRHALSPISVLSAETPRHLSCWATFIASKPIPKCKPFCFEMETLQAPVNSTDDAGHVQIQPPDPLIMTESIGSQCSPEAWSY